MSNLCSDLEQNMVLDLALRPVPIGAGHFCVDATGFDVSSRRERGGVIQVTGGKPV
jgi:hypothetical protein